MLSGPALNVSVLAYQFQQTVEPFGYGRYGVIFVDHYGKAQFSIAVETVTGKTSNSGHRTGLKVQIGTRGTAFNGIFKRALAAGSSQRREKVIECVAAVHTFEERSIITRIEESHAGKTAAVAQVYRFHSQRYRVEYGQFNTAGIVRAVTLAQHLAHGSEYVFGIHIIAVFVGNRSYGSQFGRIVRVYVGHRHCGRGIGISVYERYFDIIIVILGREVLDEFGQKRHSCGAVGAGHTHTFTGGAKSAC